MSEPLQPEQSTSAAGEPSPPNLEAAATPPPASVAFDFFRSTNLFLVLLRIAMFVVLSNAVSIALQFVLARYLARGSFFSPERLALGEGIAFLGIFAAALLMARLERRKFGEYGLPAQGAAPSQFFVGALFGLAEISTVIGVIAAFGSYHFGTLAVHGTQLLRWAAFWAIFFLVVGFYEEFSFRGYPQFTLSQAAGFWPAALVLSCAFGAVHLTNPGENGVGIAGIVLTGLFWSFTLRRTGTLWFAVGMHASFDFGETFLYSVPDSGAVFPGHLSNSTLSGPSWLTGGSAGPEGSILDFVVLLLFFYAFHRLYPAAQTPQAKVSVEPQGNPR